LTSYKGGLLVLFDENNPARFELAPHSVRELIEKSSLLTNGEVWAYGDGMKNALPEDSSAGSPVPRRNKNRSQGMEWFPIGQQTGSNAVIGRSQGLG
jgi:hypothetical protein